MAQPQAHEIGIPVRSATHVMTFAGTRADGSPCLYATMGQVGAPFFVIEIDLDSGKCRKFLADVPRADEAVHAIWSERWRALFAGSCYAGHLHRFDPKIGRLESLGLIREDQPKSATFPCRIDEHPDGTLWIGSYPGCDLTRYDPRAGTFTHYGQMDPVDMYLYPLCGADGTVAALVKMTRPHVVAVDPKTGEHRIVGPVADTDCREGSVDFFKGADGLLYIKSHAGDFRIKGLAAVPVIAAPDPMPPRSLPDGSTFQFLDGAVFEYRQLEVRAPDGRSRVLHLDWQGDGTNLFFCHRGPDGKLYGSSMLPEHLFSYDPGTKALVDHGACSTSGGEAYSMANLDGKLYVASYPAAKLSVYDPSRPYRFGIDSEANPREVGRPDDVAFRPLAMLAGPAGKVWIASIPDYGMWGGTLAWYDPKTGAFGSHRHVVRDCRALSLTHLSKENLLLVGFAVEGGTGTQPRAERAGLALWDPARDCEVWTGDLGLSIHTVFDLLAIGEGRVYAVILLNGAEERPTLFLLDMAKKEILSRCMLVDPPHGWSLEGGQTLFVHRGFVYGATYRGLYRAPLGTTDVEPYWRAAENDGPRGGGAAIGDTWYFPTYHRLRALELPGE